MRGIVGDFVHDLAALGPGRRPAAALPRRHDRQPAPGRAARRSSAQAAAVLAAGDGFLVGVDLVKDPARLHAAYNDAAGVTAEFNRNILRVLNDRLGADFDPDDFEHRAFYDRRAAVDRDAPARAAPDERPACPRAGHRAAPRRGRRDPHRALLQVHARVASRARLAGTGLVLERWITDPERLFASVLLRRA